MKKLFLILAILLVPNPIVADPNCPPNYQNVCKQLIQQLEKYKNGYFYNWDGTHLYIDSNFEIYDALDNNPRFDPGNHPRIAGADDPWITAFHRDFFPTLLNDVVAKTQNGQQAYLHLYSFVTHQYATGGISETPPSKIQAPVSGGKHIPLPSKIQAHVGGTKHVPLPSKTQSKGGGNKHIANPAGNPPLQQKVPNQQNLPPAAQATTIPIKKQIQNKNRPSDVAIQAASKPQAPLPSKTQSKGGGNKHIANPAGNPPLQQKVPNQQNLPPAAQTTTIPIKKQTKNKNRPSSVSIQQAHHNHSDKQINKTNINDHFITYHPGSHVEHNVRSYMVDSDDKVWSCNISGLGARRMKDQQGNETFFGHVETLHFQSRHLMHIPANHEPYSGCLISVHK